MIPQRVDDYIDALIREMENRIDFEQTYKTIYFGGGTPSLLNIKQLEKLFTLINKIKLEENYEITFEGNVESFSFEKLDFLYKNRVNRISVGMQTLSNRLLKIINREHTKEMFIDFLSDTKKAGFESVNIDLMFALPDQSMEELKSDLDQIMTLNINHISIYSLILEDNSVFGKMKDKYNFVDEELEYKMYDYVIKFLKENGYDHYEVSNFSKNGYESKHNLTYWDAAQYYGCGLGASGYIDNVRYENVKSITKYIENSSNLDVISTEIETLTIEEQQKEFILLGLRKLHGFSVNEYKLRFGEDIDVKFKHVLDDLISKKLISRNCDIISLASNAIFVANDVYEKFI